jgi:hypothetical protein
MRSSSLRLARSSSSNPESRIAPLAWFAAPVCMFAAALAGLGQVKDVGPKPEILPDANGPVTVTDNGTSWVLDNGYLTATINKNTGDMVR